MQSKFTRKNFQFSDEHTNRRTNDARNSHPPPSSSLLIGKNQTENQDTKNVKRKTPSESLSTPFVKGIPLDRAVKLASCGHWRRLSVELRPVSKFSLSFCLRPEPGSKRARRSRRRCSCPRGNTCTDTTEGSTRGTVFSSRLICA